MKLFMIVAESVTERGEMIPELRRVLRERKLDQQVVVTISPENALVIHMVVDSSVNEKQERILKAMQNKIKAQVLRLREAAELANNREAMREYLVGVRQRIMRSRLV